MAYRVTTPNLPGMRPSQQTWVMRYSKQNFRKPSSRPGSAQPIGNVSLGEFFEKPEEPLQRPGSAGKAFRELEENGISFVNYDSPAGNNNNNSSRPFSANLSRSMPNFTGTDFDPYRPDRNAIGSHSRPQSASSAKLPDFVSKDRQVCRFYGHFFQKRNWDQLAPLGEPQVEKEIARFLTIMVYTATGEVEIYEPLVVNSGINNGMFFRKGMITKDDGSPLVLTDMYPGAKIDMLGQKVYFTDADKFTRKYFEEELGTPLAAGLPRPKTFRGDIGAQYATGMGAAVATRAKTSFGTRSTDYLAVKEIKDKTNRFLRYEGRVLRFQCVEVKSKVPPYFPHLQNKMASQGYYGPVASADAKRFALSYSLSTSNIELVVQRPMKGVKDPGGQDEPRMILKKSKLPKNWREAQRGRPPNYYEPEDFACGQVIDVYGRLFLLVHADKFTRNLYKEMGITQQDVMLVAEDRAKIVQPIPQLGDGFLAIGSAEDTLSTVYGMPKPTKDMDKISRNQNRLIRCKATMLTNNPIDSSREFLITFYLEDDTVQVYEEARRNSGIWGGTFLKRGRYMNDLPNDSDVPRYFKPTDIFLGNVISFHGNEFQILEMDNASLNFCESYPDEFPLSDTFKIIGTLMFNVIEQQLDIRPHLHKFDPEGKNYLGVEKFVDALDELGLTASLNDQELLTLMRRFKDELTDMYYYDEFCDLLSHAYHRTHNIKLDAPTSNQQKAAYKRSSMDLSSFQAYKNSARLRTIQWRRTFRKDPNTVTGYVTLAVLDKLFRKHGYLLSDDILEEFYKRYRVDDDVAAPILEDLHKVHADTELYDGYDKKIAPKRLSGPSSPGTAAAATASYQRGIMAHKAAEMRRRNSSVTSVLRKHDHSHVETDSVTDARRAKALIDYHKLCDDIYICDWVNEE